MGLVTVRLRVINPGDSCLLGTVTLEALGLMLDPIRRELRPLPLLLG